jgi:hypothetical protein
MSSNQFVATQELVPFTLGTTMFFHGGLGPSPGTSIGRH